MHSKTIQNKNKKFEKKKKNSKKKKIKRGGANGANNAQLATLMSNLNLTIDQARAMCEIPRTDIYSPNDEPGGGGPGGGVRSREPEEGARGPGGGGPGGGVREGSSSVTIPDDHKMLPYVDVKTELLSTFKMDFDKRQAIFNFDITKKKKKVPSDKDCVIIALDLLGLISPKTADLMRIVAIGLTGLSAIQIVKIMEITTDYKHRLHIFFKYHLFWEILLQLTTEENKALFCAITRTNGSRHAFIVVHFDKRIYVVDPSMLSDATEITILEDSCPSHTQGITEWYVLFRSEYKLTDEQKKQTGFINL